MLMLLAALLFPIDVGVRRLRLAADDWQRLLAWVRERLHRPARAVSTARQPLLGELFEARERARRRGARETTEIQLPSEESVHQMPVSASEPRRAERPLTSAAQPDQTGERPGRAGSDSEEDTLARLHQARQRAQRRR